MTITAFTPDVNVNLPMIDYHEVQVAVNKGVVTAAHFATVIDHRQWALLDHEDDEMIYETSVRRVFEKNNVVEILVYDNDHPKGYALKFDADEYALRIEAT